MSLGVASQREATSGKPKDVGDGTLPSGRARESVARSSLLAAVVFVSGCDRGDIAVEHDVVEHDVVEHDVVEASRSLVSLDDGDHEAVASVSSGTEALTRVDLQTSAGPLGEQLGVQAVRAIRTGKRPFVEMRASWCPICKRVDAALAGPELAAELKDVVLIVVDTDRFASDLAGAGLTSPTIPAFYALDRRGRPTPHWLQGHRWGPRADLSERLRAYFVEP